MLNQLREPLKPLINFVAYLFSWIDPDILSLGTLVLSIPGYYFLAIGDSLLGSLFIIGAAFDAIDGAVARLIGKESKFGGVWDATIDRLYEGFLLLSIGIGGLVDWEILFAFYIFSVAFGYIKAKAEAVSKTDKVGMNQFSGGLLERGERITVLFIIILFDGLFTDKGHEIITIGMIFLAIGSFISFLQRTWKVRSVIK